MIFLAHAVCDPPVTSNGIHHGAQVQYLDRIVKLVFLMVTQWRSHRPTLKVDQYQSKNGLFFSRFADHRSCELLIAFEVFCLSMLEYFLNRAGAHCPNSNDSDKDYYTAQTDYRLFAISLERKSGIPWQVIQFDLTILQ
ncbi:hypothetical protein BASA50_010086 [Batrachochytrium salamandrivorans]|uniref:Uncharacterized protein n=1 Tax=Batrachochytrium salamandrivorans TaxID=1357716 RepID=A0ABQ8EZC8_9FUNG|nr:hypothetical protein BASA50_010086 [Batrachochytrium salamandrivorans]